MLFRYDSRHIRAYKHTGHFFEFSHMRDELLPIAEELFCHTSEINMSLEQFQKCCQLVELYQQEAIEIIIDFCGEHLKIEVLSLHFSYSRIIPDPLSWKKKFLFIMDNYALERVCGLENKESKEILYSFLELCELNFPFLMRINIYYKNGYFPIPFELLADKFLVVHYFYENNVSIPSCPISKVGILFDPDLKDGQTEFLKTYALSKRLGYQINQKNPDVLFIGGHGIIKDSYSMLENNALQELSLDTTPSIVVFNSCLLGQEVNGIIKEFLDRNCIVIVSPFHVLSGKFLFSPLLRFLYNTSPNSVEKAFQLMRIFYPDVSSYFRILMKKTPPK